MASPPGAMSTQVRCALENYQAQTGSKKLNCSNAGLNMPPQWFLVLLDPPISLFSSKSDRIYRNMPADSSKTATSAASAVTTKRPEYRPLPGLDRQVLRYRYLSSINGAFPSSEFYFRNPAEDKHRTCLLWISK